MLIGASKFMQGVTTIARTTDPDMLNKVSGWSAENGYAEPIGFPAEIVEGSGFTASEKPSFVYTDGTTETMLVIDSTDHLWEVNLSATPVTMTNTGYHCVMEVDSMMTRMGKQVVIPCTDGIKVWEPGITTGTVRLLSIKSPQDYAPGAKPVATFTQNSSTILFSDTADDWVVDKCASRTETADKVIFALDTTSTNGRIAYRSIGSTGISLSGKEWLLMDIKLTGDTQDYSRTGLFVNNPALLPSGYSIKLYSDTGCTALITTILIPKLDTDSKIHRCLFNVAGFTSTVKGVAVYAEDFCVAPLGAGTRSLTLYTEEWRADWKHKGNFLLPAFSFSASPLSEYTKVDSTANKITSATNLLADHGGFEQSPLPSEAILGWAKEGGDVGENNPYVSAMDWFISASNAYRDMPRSGSASCNIEGNQSTDDEDDKPRTKQIKSDVVNANANTRYRVEYWIRRPRSVSGNNWGNNEVYNSFKFYTKITATGGTTQYLYIPHSGATWISSDLNETQIIASTMEQRDCNNNYHHIVQYFTTPTGTTGMSVTIGVNPSEFYGGINVDDVSLSEVNVDASGSTYIIQDFAEDGSEVTNELPQLRYSYAFAGKSSSSARDYYLLLSNPSDDSSPTLVADPWGSFTLTATIPAAVATDYAGLITDVAFYRSVYDVMLDTWGAYYLCGKGIISAGSATAIDTGDIVPLYVGNYELPFVMETSNDPGFSARHVTYADNRLYCGNLEYALDNDGVTSDWQRKTTMQISTYNKTYAFPTTTDSDSPPSYGSELEGFTKLTSDIRHMDNIGATKYAFGDQEIYSIIGNNSSDGWYATQRDTIGCVSSRLTVCRREGIIWYDGNYFYMMTTDGVQNISSMRLKKNGIDLTKSYGACGCNSKYYCYCYYDGAWSLLEYDLYLNAWFVHVSTAYQLKSICASYDDAYGVCDGDTANDIVVKITGNAVDIGDRTIATSYIACGDPTIDTQLSQVVIDANVTANCTAYITVDYIGAKNASVTREIAMVTDETRYHVNVNALASAAKVTVTFTDANCPKINFVGFTYDGMAR